MFSTDTSAPPVNQFVLPQEAKVVLWFAVVALIGLLLGMVSLLVWASGRVFGTILVVAIVVVALRPFDPISRWAYPVGALLVAMGAPLSVFLRCPRELDDALPLERVNPDLHAELIDWANEVGAASSSPLGLWVSSAEDVAGTKAVVVAHRRSHHVVFERETVESQWRNHGRFLFMYLHELAHIVNGDVRLWMVADGLFRAGLFILKFLAIGGLFGGALMLAMGDGFPQEAFGTLGLMAVDYGIVFLVLRYARRQRELHADLRADYFLRLPDLEPLFVREEVRVAVQAASDTLADTAALAHDNSPRSLLGRLLGTHPSRQTRRRTLELGRTAIVPTNPWLALWTGLSVPIVAQVLFQFAGKLNKEVARAIYNYGGNMAGLVLLALALKPVPGPLLRTLANVAQISALYLVGQQLGAFIGSVPNIVLGQPWSDPTANQGAQLAIFCVTAVLLALPLRAAFTSGRAPQSVRRWFWVLTIAALVLCLAVAVVFATVEEVSFVREWLGDAFASGTLATFLVMLLLGSVVATLHYCIALALLRPRCSTCGARFRRRSTADSNAMTNVRCATCGHLLFRPWLSIDDSREELEAQRHREELARTG